MLNTSGQISLGGSVVGESINLEFGNTATTQISFSQLYRNGPFVGPNNTNVPTSGPISVYNFYGASRERIPVTITISANTSNYVLSTSVVPGYYPGLTDVTCIINSGVVVNSTSTGSPAFSVNTSFSSTDTVTIVNNGTIMGAGGAGGSYSTGGAGGGPALTASRAISLNNLGTIAGGGGGGGYGGGGSASNSYTSGSGKSAVTYSVTVYAGGGGGGGGGTMQAGTANYATAYGGTGGAGGGLGAAGAGGSNGSPGVWYGASGAGAGGSCVVGNSNITWVNTGTRYGALS